MSQTVNETNLDAWTAQQVCPQCGGTGFDVQWRLVTIPHGAYSLAGVQTKFAATNTPFLVCSTGCGLEKQGKR